jgi:mannose-6-phosphate isomerase-like protein (cupin superfamily)
VGLAPPILMENNMELKAFAVDLNDSKEFQRLLDKETQSCGMKSGRVYLESGKNCTQHSTKENEEMLIFLSGHGQAIIEGVEPFDIGAGKVAYIPPETLHDIKNTGDEPLIYVYCVAPANK